MSSCASPAAVPAAARRLAPIVALAALLSLAPGRAAAQDERVAADPQAAASLAALMEASGTKPERVQEGVWRVVATGDHLPRFAVLVSVYNQYVLTQSVARETPTLSAAQMSDLLKLNYDRDLVKIALDPDGDLSVLNETELAALDAPRLARIIRAVAATADHVAGVIPIDVPAPPPPSTFEALTAPTDGRLESMALASGRATLRYDAAIWQVAPADGMAEQRLKHIDGDIYVLILSATSGGCRSDAGSADAILELARATAPDARLTRHGRRQVNGRDFQVVHLDATIDGVPIAVVGHCHADEAGSITLLGLGGRDAIPAYREAIERVVAGVVFAGSAREAGARHLKN
jgi:hypothetical protein